MSIAYLNRAFASGLKPTPRLVLLCLANFADERGVCFPRVGTVACHTGLSPRAVRQALRTLEAAGWLVATPHQGRASVYRLREQAGTPAAAADAPRHPAPPPPAAAAAITPMEPLIPAAPPAPSPAPPIPRPPPTPTPAAQLSLALRAAGMHHCWPGHPDIVALAAEDPGRAAVLALYADLRAHPRRDPLDTLNPAYLAAAWRTRRTCQERGAGGQEGWLGVRRPAAGLPVSRPRAMSAAPVTGTLHRLDFGADLAAAAAYRRQQRERVGLAPGAAPAGREVARAA